VDVLAWTVTRGRRGVFYANLGTVGASVDLMDTWDPGLLRQDLAHLAPSLIVLAFGTNEGFRDSTDPAGYAAIFANRLRELHAAAPGAALLVLGPPDGYRRRGKKSTAPPACGDPNWTEPPNLAPIREVQRSVAAREGAYFWDWQAAMGGACSMLRWAATKPPMAAPDHVHLFEPGYQATAEALFRAIMDGYERYRALRPAA
jgi:lysophospholipase L1-like esterase